MPECARLQTSAERARRHNAGVPPQRFGGSAPVPAERRAAPSARVPDAPVGGADAEARAEAPREEPAAGTPAGEPAHDPVAVALPQTHGGRAQRCNAGAPPERFGFAARLDPIAEEGRRWQRRVRSGRRGRKLRRVSSSEPPRRAGGSAEGVTVGLRRPLGRLGMQPLNATLAHRAASPLPPQPACVPTDAAPSVWGSTRLSGVGASQCDGERQAVRELETAAAAAALPVFGEPNPKSVAEALSRPDGAEWQRAIDDEVASCLHFGVWSECDLPPGKQALPSRFVLERKRCGRYKARLVAGGHRQRHGLDFDETFAPVCSYRTLRIMLAVAAREDLELRQFDIKTAFLNGELQEEVYIRQPSGA